MGLFDLLTGPLRAAGRAEDTFFKSGDAALKDPQVQKEMGRAESTPVARGLVDDAKALYHLSHSAYSLGSGDFTGAFGQAAMGLSDGWTGASELFNDGLGVAKDVMGVMGGIGGGDRQSAPAPAPADGPSATPNPHGWHAAPEPPMVSSAAMYEGLY